MTESKAHRTKSGRTLSRKDVDAIAEEVEQRTMTWPCSRHAAAVDR